MDDKERFLKYVVRGEKCWLWKGGTKNSVLGYGGFYYRRKGMGAHRASFLIFNGEIPAGAQVCHSCDNPRCVNPEHLWLGTAQMNAADSIIKGRKNFVMSTPLSKRLTAKAT